MPTSSLGEPIKKQLLHGLAGLASKAFTFALILSACSSPYTVSINNTAVFDPQDRLYTGEVRSADLQGCINFALRQQKIESEDLIEDISPLLRIQTLRSLNLAGNNSIPCRDVEELTRRMGANFTAPNACKP